MAKPTLEELLAQKADLDRKIELTRQASRTKAIADVRAIMIEHNLLLADLAKALEALQAKTPKAARAPRASKRPNPPSLAGGTPHKDAPAKYRDPATGNTWSGRGARPRWLTAALAEGKALDDFAA